MSAELATAMLLIGFFVFCCVFAGIGLMSLACTHRPATRATAGSKPDGLAGR